MNPIDPGYVPESMAGLPGRIHILEDRSPKQLEREKALKEQSLRRRREAEKERRAQDGAWYQKKLAADRKRYWQKKGKK